MSLNIAGIWYNQLGSVMEISEHDSVISGKYHTAVGAPKGQYQIVGRIDLNNTQNKAIGWTVVWENEFGSFDSVTTWSGQYQIVSGQEMIITTWLLTKETNPQDDWRSTLIGHDKFYRTPFTPEQIAFHKQQGAQNSSPAIA